MASTITSKEYNGTGSQNTFAYAFQSYQKEDVKVTVGGNVQTQGTHYQIDSYTAAGGTINFSVGGNAATYYNGSSTVTASPPAGTGNIRVYRETDITAGSVGEYEPKATYVAGSSIKAADLNNNAKQALYASFELRDQEIQETKIRDGAVTSAKIKDDTIVNADVNSAAAIAGTKISPDFGSQAVVTTGTLAAGATTVTGNIAVSGTVDGRDVATDGTKLDGIEAGATADQTNAEIRAAVEAASDSNVFTDADHTKLNGIETNATADQTNAEIRTAVEAASDSNVFTDADHTKLNGIAASANNYSISADLLDEDDFATDSATKVPSQQSTKAYIGTYAQPKDADLTTLAGMQSGTASILAGGTALTSTLSELNLLDGKSIVTTIAANATDVQLPSAQAVNERIVTVMQDSGGFVPIADKDSFPETNPDPNDDAGTIISIADAGGLVVNGSGVSTTGDTITTNATVTINGIDSSLNNSTIAAGKGMLVETTSTLNTYTYHRLVVDEAGVASAQTLVSDFNDRYQVAGSAPSQHPDGSALADGDLWFDTSANVMKVYDLGNTSYAAVTSVGDYKLLTVVPDGATSGTPTFNGAADVGTDILSFDLRDGSNAASITSVGQLLVSLNGVIQKPNSGSWSASNEGFHLEGTNGIKFCTAPNSGASVFVTLIGSATSVNVPATNSIVEAAIQTNVVSEEKLKIHNNPTNTHVLTADATVTGGMKWAATANASPTTTRGDIIYRGASADERLAKGTSGQYLKIGANDPEWADVVGAVADGCIFENDQTISNNYTIAAGKGAHSVGPITVNATVTVNGNWVVS